MMRLLLGDSLGVVEPSLLVGWELRNPGCSMSHVGCWLIHDGA